MHIKIFLIFISLQCKMILTNKKKYLLFFLTGLLSFSETEILIVYIAIVRSIMSIDGKVFSGGGFFSSFFDICKSSIGELEREYAKHFCFNEDFFGSSVEMCRYFSRT